MAERNEATAQIYANLPLRTPDSIRLLSLRAQQAGAQLHGSLRVIQLRESPCPPFAALSYVWKDAVSSAVPGSGARTQDSGAALIRVSDCVNSYTCQLEITANCYSALCHILKRFGAMEIWVDAICIDQANQEEKLHQIPLMRDVYTSAEDVYLWLGDGDHHTDLVIKQLRRRAAMTQRIPLAYLTARNLQKKRIELAKYRRECRRDMYCGWFLNI